MNQYIGVAGITSAAESRAIAAMLSTLDPTGSRLGCRKVMAGVLASAKSLAGVKNKQWKRYPLPQDIASCFIDDSRFLNTIHVAPGDDSNAQAILCDGIRTAGRLCHAVQVNAKWPSADMLKAARRTGEDVGNRPYQVVLQLGPAALAEAKWELKDFVLAYPTGCFDAVLYDVSGGNSVGIDDTAPLRVLQLKESLDRVGIGIGIAGGFDAAKVADIRSLLAHGVSVDAEGRLRDDSPNGGNLDLVKVRAYLDAALERP